MFAIADAKFWKKKSREERREHRKEFLADIGDAVKDIKETIVEGYEEIVNGVPTVPDQWQADAVQDMEGNVPGVRPGKTPYHSFYDYPNRHRYQYDTYDVVYDFVAGKAYKIKANGKCCYKDNTDPDTGNPKAMIQIAPSSKAKDVGAKDGGEDWQQKANLIIMKETTDFIINSDNVVLQWNQDIQVGKDGSQGWMTVDVAYTNTQVGNLTDADFLTDKTADCTATCVLSDWEVSLMDAGLAFPAVEDEPDFLQ